MKLIKEEKISKQIIKPYFFDFTLSEDAPCLIEIIASAKSWWQNFKFGRAFFKDDDIFLFLDNQELTTSKYTKGDARSAWNGNELCSLEKTVLVASNLKKGKHIIDLKIDQRPYLKSISITKIEEDKIVYVPANNNPAQKSEGRPWQAILFWTYLLQNYPFQPRLLKTEVMMTTSNY